MDGISPRHRAHKVVWPWLTLLAVLAMLGIRVYLLLLEPPHRSEFLFHWGVVPVNVLELLSQPVSLWPGLELASLFSALLVHGSWPHLLGNLADLWVFGIPLERYVGHAGFLFVFLFAGGLTNLLLVLQVPGLATPVIGASGGVSAVIGCYLTLFPSRRIGVYLPLGLYLQYVSIPSLLVIGSWFVLQVAYTVFGPVAEQIAWRVHVEGFVAGILGGLLLWLVSARVRLHVQQVARDRI